MQLNWLFELTFESYFSQQLLRKLDFAQWTCYNSTWNEKSTCLWWFLLIYLFILWLLCQSVTIQSCILKPMLNVWKRVTYHSLPYEQYLLLQLAEIIWNLHFCGNVSQSWSIKHILFHQIHISARGVWVSVPYFMD